jgi:hypothetical protein
MPALDLCRVSITNPVGCILESPNYLGSAAQVLAKPARPDHKPTLLRGKIMATADSSTGVRASVPVLLPVPPLEALAALVCAYESFQLLAMSESGHDAPVPIVLAELNHRLRHIVDQLDNMGLLS